MLKKFPGVGGRTAERYAFQVLNWSPSELKEMAHLLENMREYLTKCDCCGCLKEAAKHCMFCEDSRRDPSILCIIASPREAYAIDETRQYMGLFHVLGVLSPMEGRGPDLLALEKLKKRVIDLSIKEVIIALDSTLEGDTTAHYLRQELGPLSVHVSRLAMGLPMGSSLEFIDGSTLAQAFSGRRTF